MIKRRRQDRLQCLNTGGNQTSVLTSAISRNWPFYTHFYLSSSLFLLLPPTVAHTQWVFRALQFLHLLSLGPPGSQSYQFILPGSGICSLLV